jgi:cytochrome c oxidase subunit 2
MTALVIIAIVVLVAIILVQLGKLAEVSAVIRGEELAQSQQNNRSAKFMLVFLVGFLIFCVGSAWHYKDIMLAYGPHSSASAHGGSLDSLFNTTLFFTGIVFVLTHIALFWFSYKYKEDKNRIAYFFPHSLKLEIYWTVIPAVVMAYLVIQGLIAWNSTMADIKPGEEHIEIEATGYQFAWDVRYPGADGKIGTKNYKLIDTGSNPLGQDWTDEKNHDDFFVGDELVLPVGKKIRVRITAKDVLHNFYLPHFRVKMDAIPGLPTHFIFTPIKTTAEYRQELKNYPEWQEPADPTDPESPQRWEVFDYELACSELCGTGHWSMRKRLTIVSEEEYEAWFAQQQSYYMTNVRNGDDDPYKGQLLGMEIKNRSREIQSEFTSAMSSDTISTIRLKNVFFNTGSAELKDDSKYELNEISTLLKQNPNVKVELGGHTDSVGDDSMNEELSMRRATSVVNYLKKAGVKSQNMSSKGYGEKSPVAPNDTEEGRQENRRTELRIISK